MQICVVLSRTDVGTDLMKVNQVTVNMELDAGKDVVFSSC